MQFNEKPSVLAATAPLPSGMSAIIDAVIGAAIEVHRTLGPGFLESVYEGALCVELAGHDIAHERQAEVPVRYKDQLVGKHRLDLLVAKTLIVELKTVHAFESRHFAVVRSYLTATG